MFELINYSREQILFGIVTYNLIIVITDLQYHHEKILAHWNMVNAKNEVVGNGTDFAIYENGKLKQITGFFKPG